MSKAPARSSMSADSVRPSNACFRAACSSGEGSVTTALARLPCAFGLADKRRSAAATVSPSESMPATCRRSAILSTGASSGRACTSSCRCSSRRRLATFSSLSLPSSTSPSHASFTSSGSSPLRFHTKLKSSSNVPSRRSEFILNGSITAPASACSMLSFCTSKRSVSFISRTLVSAASPSSLPSSPTPPVASGSAGSAEGPAPSSSSSSSSRARRRRSSSSSSSLSGTRPGALRGGGLSGGLVKPDAPRPRPAT
mmetsp:Transcript_57323/g.150544  ORF Transcript_57323/g.150544 Transcript_57323/m.150544 type:complete len:255 (+) Transcript_57323:95-859(+)